MRLAASSSHSCSSPTISGSSTSNRYSSADTFAKRPSDGRLDKLINELVSVDLLRITGPDRRTRPFPSGFCRDFVKSCGR